MARTKFFVVPAPNHYGAGSDLGSNDTTTVISAYCSYRAALKGIESTTTLCIRVGPLARGANFARHSENHYPLATGEIES